MVPYFDQRSILRGRRKSDDFGSEQYSKLRHSAFGDGKIYRYGLRDIR